MPLSGGKFAPYESGEKWEILTENRAKLRESTREFEVLENSDRREQSKAKRQ